MDKLRLEIDDPEMNSGLDMDMSCLVLRCLVGRNHQHTCMHTHTCSPQNTRMELVIFVIDMWSLSLVCQAAGEAHQREVAGAPQNNG